MKRTLVALILTIFSLTALLPASTSRAGDVIDYLPEVQTARSFEIMWIAALGDLFSNFEDVCESDIPTPDEMPDHLLVDINGDLRPEDESIELAIYALCILSNTSELDEIAIFEDPAQLYQTTFEVLRGESVTFGNGTVIDGSKQIFRMAASVHLMGLFGFLSPLPELLGSESPEHDCAVLKQAIQTGQTLELRYLAMFVLTFPTADQLMDDHEDEISPTTSLCGEVSTAPLVELQTAAMGGDVDAAVDLAARQFADILIYIGDEPDVAEEPRIFADLERYELAILSNTARFPLVTLADSMSLFILELAVDFIEGDFE